MITVKNNNVNKSARKVRQVCDLIRRKKVEDNQKIKNNGIYKYHETF